MPSSGVGDWFATGDIGAAVSLRARQRPNPRRHSKPRTMARYDRRLVVRRWKQALLQRHARRQAARQAAADRRRTRPQRRSRLDDAGRQRAARRRQGLRSGGRAGRRARRRRVAGAGAAAAGLLRPAPARGGAAGAVSGAAIGARDVASAPWSSRHPEGRSPRRTATVARAVSSAVAGCDRKQVGGARGPRLPGRHAP